jgi:hypothetical protein
MTRKPLSKRKHNICGKFWPKHYKACPHCYPEMSQHRTDTDNAIKRASAGRFIRHHEQAKANKLYIAKSKMENT